MWSQIASKISNQISRSNTEVYLTTPPIPFFSSVLAKPNGTWQCQATLREQHRDPTSFFFSFSLLNNPCKCTSGRPVFEYAGYYENREHDNHERFPDVRTMSSPRSWTGANGNKTSPERHYRHREYWPLSTSAAFYQSGVFHNMQWYIRIFILNSFHRKTIFNNLIM